MAQWKRAGPITQRSEDQNLALLSSFFSLTFFHISFFFWAKDVLNISSIFLVVKQNPQNKTTGRVTLEIRLSVKKNCFRLTNSHLDTEYLEGGKTR